MRTYEQIRDRHDIPKRWIVAFAGPPDEARATAADRREAGVPAEVYPLFPEDCSEDETGTRTRDGTLTTDGGTIGSLWETRVVFSARAED